MIRVYIICEGPTEETFIKELLAPEFLQFNINLVPCLIRKGKSNRRDTKGGAVKYQRILNDLKLYLIDKNAFCTTFFDFYGLDKNFPGKARAISNGGDADQKFQTFLQDFSSQLQKDLPDSYRRIIPYVQMYEFEGVLFSDPSILANNINVEVAKVVTICEEFSTPEDINNSKETAPSKRIEKLCPSYDKVIQGNMTALDIGYQKIASECPLFASWVERIKKITNV